MSTEVILGGAIMISLTLYVLMGGADYGGGVWDLLAFGPRRDQQKELIAEAIAPIWEANHVWLILVVVILFTAYPSAFAGISVYLHLPLTLLLLGIIARGTSFTFRTYDSRLDSVQRRWGRVFSISSMITPILLGITVGAVSAGNFPVKPVEFLTTYVTPWTTPFCFAVGAFALVLFSFLAAVYLAVEAKDEDLKTDFQKRALIAQMVCAVLALSVFLLSHSEAPEVPKALAASPWSIPLQLTTAFFAIASIVTLIKRKFEIARFCAVGQVTLILWGWALSQYPYILRPQYTLFNSGGSHTTQVLLIWALAAGTVILVPSFWLLLHVFKREREPFEEM